MKRGDLGGNRTRDNLIKRPIRISPEMAVYLAFWSKSIIKMFRCFIGFFASQQNCSPELRQNNKSTQTKGEHHAFNHISTRRTDTFYPRDYSHCIQAIQRKVMMINGLTVEITENRND